jgi:hypothetical protein
MKLFDVFCIGVAVIISIAIIGFVILAFIKIPYLFVSIVVWFGAWYLLYIFGVGVMLIDDFLCDVRKK